MASTAQQVGRGDEHSKLLANRRTVPKGDQVHDVAPAARVCQVEQWQPSPLRPPAHPPASSAAPTATPTMIHVVALVPLLSLPPLPVPMGTPLLPSVCASGSPGSRVPSACPLVSPPLLPSPPLPPLPVSLPPTATASTAGPPGQGLMKAATRTLHGRPSPFRQATRTCTASGLPPDAQKSMTGVVAQPAAPVDAAPAPRTSPAAFHSSKEYWLGPRESPTSCEDGASGRGWR